MLQHSHSDWALEFESNYSAATLEEGKQLAKVHWLKLPKFLKGLFKGLASLIIRFIIASSKTTIVYQTLLHCDCVLAWAEAAWFLEEFCHPKRHHTRNLSTKYITSLLPVTQNPSPVWIFLPEKNKESPKFLSHTEIPQIVSGPQ